MRVKTSVNYPNPNYSETISHPKIVEWVNNYFDLLPNNTQYVTLQFEDKILGVKVFFKQKTEPNLTHLSLLLDKADIVSWGYPNSTETEYLTTQTRFQMHHYYVSIDAFVQSNLENRIINTYLDGQIHGRYLGIGGLGGYFYNSNCIDGSLVITNSKAIYQDCLYNNVPSKHVDYNHITIDIDQDYDTILVNIGIKGLPNNLKSQLNQIKFQKLFYIGCNPEKNRQDLEHFTENVADYQFTVQEFNKVWLFTLERKPDQTKPNKYEYVSLGLNCSVAYNLGELGVRTKAYPFDWVKISLKQLVTVLEDDFSKWFTGLKQLKISTNHPYINSEGNWVKDENDEETLVVENAYGVKFFHDFKASISLEDQIAEFTEKYQRRIDRFRLLFNMTTNITNNVIVKFIIQSSKVSIDLLNLKKHIEKCRHEFIIIIPEAKYSAKSNCKLITELDRQIGETTILLDKGGHVDWKLENFPWEQIILF